METNCLLNSKNDNRIAGTEIDDEDFSEEDEKMIKEMA
jgi:hypothetical protein